jgi:PAS domain S-box-containing protein
MTYFSMALKEAAEQDLEHLVRNIYSTCRVQQEMVQRRVTYGLKTARQLFNSGEALHSQGMPSPAGESRLTGSNPGQRKRVSLSPDNRFVDQVEESVGLACSILQLVEGNRLLLTSTTILRKNGERAIGTQIPSTNPITKAVLSGRSYLGRTQILDNWYISAVEPIYGDNGLVTGILAVGIKEQIAQSFQSEIKNIRVGDTGYAYIMDSKGNLRIHPAKEGENILDARDSSGFEYIRAMITDAVALEKGVVGTNRYPWINPELGEKRARQKINKYIYFKPWDWVIAAGSYEDEVYQSIHETERFILIAVIAGLALVLFLTVTLSKVLTRPIQDLIAVTTKMEGGDLSQRVSVYGADEIGLLGRAFNRMVFQIQDYTSNLEKMVERRTWELRNSKEKYRELSGFLNSILDSATEYAIIAFDASGEIIEYNQGAERLFGWQKTEVLHKENIHVTILREDRERGLQQEMSQRTRTDGVFELEMTRVRKNGERFPALSTITPIMDSGDKKPGFVEIVRDLTRTKFLEKELRETKEFLENIMESSVNGIVTTNLKGKITYLNRAMEKLINYSREEILGTHISHFYVKGIDEAREIMNILRKEERSESYDMEVKTKNGDVMNILTSIFLIRDEENNIIGTAGIFKDITEQKRLEVKLKAAQANLVEASKMRALGELVAGVAHELNNPLMASKTILHVILKNLHEGCPNRDRLELISKCNNRIEKIVDHLRDFSRQTKPEWQELDINLPIQNSLLITGQRLLNHNISIVRRLSEGLPRISGDSSQLEQVFLNLISNAMDAMYEVTGPKELTICSDLVKEATSDVVTVSVRDTGPGIPKEYLDKVFEPFFSTKPVGKGTGLGLSLCFGIIEAHGGRIEIFSSPGKGTEVRITLPLAGNTKGEREWGSESSS